MTTIPGGENLTYPDTAPESAPHEYKSLQRVRLCLASPAAPFPH